jgi:hypothetical protein
VELRHGPRSPSITCLGVAPSWLITRADNRISSSIKLMAASWFQQAVLFHAVPVPIGTSCLSISYGYIVVAVPAMRVEQRNGRQVIGSHPRYTCIVVRSLVYFLIIKAGQKQHLRENPRQLYFFQPLDRPSTNI